LSRLVRKANNMPGEAHTNGPLLVEAKAELNILLCIVHSQIGLDLVHALRTLVTPDFAENSTV